jgi:hypothetical protein
MFTTGFSLKLKDLRVDHMLKSKGYNLSHTTIYYSPIITHLLFIVLILTFSLPPLIIYIWSFIILYYNFVVIYLIVIYLLGAYLNNSIAITETDLIIINPNFPFKKIKVYPFQNIESLEVKSSKIWLLTFPFLSLGGNFIRIYHKKYQKRYFCISLQEDAYDENWTELTIEDLISNLQNRKMKVEHNF